MPRRSKAINDQPCKLCGILVYYKADIPRHDQTHKREKVFKCPHNGCTYEGLQKSNLKTHMNTHTGEKPHACPDCDFCTGDPGSLTRHKKKSHYYITNRKNSRAKSAFGTKQTQHYSLTAEAPPFPDSLDIPTPCEDDLSYTWEKDSDPNVPFSPSLFGLWPTVDTSSEFYSNIDFSYLPELFTVSMQAICSEECFYYYADPTASLPSCNAISSGFNTGVTAQRPAPLCSLGICQWHTALLHGPAPTYYPSPNPSSSSLNSEPCVFPFDCTSLSPTPFPMGGASADAFLGQPVSFLPS